MIINGARLLKAAPIKDMLTEKRRQHGVSHGLAEAGYDIRLKQSINFFFNYQIGKWQISVRDGDVPEKITNGRFTLASAIEEFQMPANLMGLVKDKSTWARQGLSVFNTVIEPGWDGFLTLELVHNGSENLTIPAGAGIAQVIFHPTSAEANYSGKYQNQEDKPIDSRFV